jgi:hypothetical protein
MRQEEPRVGKAHRWTTNGILSAFIVAYLRFNRTSFCAVFQKAARRKDPWLALDLIVCVRGCRL